MGLRGYRRAPGVHDALLNAIRAAMLTYPEQRLGQVVTNAVGEPGASDLFNVHDEDLTQKLWEYARSRGT